MSVILTLHEIQTKLDISFYTGSYISTSTSGTTYAAILMGVLILIVTVALIIIIVFLALSKAKLQKKLSETRMKNNAQIYEDVDLSQIIDSMKNVAYEAPQLHT